MSYQSISSLLLAVITRNRRLYSSQPRHRVHIPRRPEAEVTRDDWYGRSAGSSVATIRAMPESYVDLPVMRTSAAKDLAKLPEIQQLEIFRGQLLEGTCALPPSMTSKGRAQATYASSGMNSDDVMDVIRAGFSTLLLHVHSRVVSSLGLGFYTIGSAGEELAAVTGLLLRPTDAMALHYRHLSAQIARQLRSGRDIKEILLNRARGHTVSSLDPVTGGVHCAIGGGSYDFVVTSTLASQASPAVGRALGNSLAHALKLGPDVALFPKKTVSYVSLGDGSVNNAHFLSALNLADYSYFRKFKCPVVFGISDNNICISLRGHNWVRDRFLSSRCAGIPVFEAFGGDMFDSWSSTRAAIEHARRINGPVIMYTTDLPRRFGHAATDRQYAYLSAEEIDAAQTNNPLEAACAQAVQAGVTTYADLHSLFCELDQMTAIAFDIAVNEPKITDVNALISRNSAPLAQVPVTTTADSVRLLPHLSLGNDKPDKNSKPEVMRKHMTKVIDETLSENANAVYIGEDVQHGGYYVVTDGLHKKYPLRICDFPPDETGLIGAGIGYAQAGLLPIVEIPYAKYLDCGGDMFFEAAITNWLTAGKQPLGMVIRLQGFDRGVFGGNFHTHNSLHIPPGVDVICYSNGPDYARGFRNAVRQAKAGRLVMLVDSTNLLNMRHLFDGRDDSWRFPFTNSNEEMSFDEIRTYGKGTSLAVVTYGNGVVTALQACKRLSEEFGLSDISVIDVPYLSDVPAGLKEALPKYERVVFADVCKSGQNPLSSFVTSLQSEELLPGGYWECVAAKRTYNPLGSTITFTNVEDIMEEVIALHAES